MLTLNMVSAEQKKEIRLRHIYGFVKTINLTLIIITIAIAIILLAAKIILQSKFNDTISQTTLVTKTNQSYNNNIREINNKLNFIAKIQTEFIPWSNLIKSLAEITPADINFYYVKLDSLEQTIKINGRAGLRSSLLNFKEKMKATAYFKEIEFPIKNILEKENIDFEINAKLNLLNL
ncbi:MAG: hypothetical protein UU95_C0027G0006 [Parcubacteria group bacterium GW2011_GWC2_42_12]|uniref:Fimbrial assembly family protein n=1 Tax=Candidatus Falkowbacteria bacterium GW2011_GWA2_41_14 TaxID=1618635 RepID=A0A0G0X4Y6_9BACT|nr:MAG: hypothetical protein UU43_C0002G0029 [Candidatus Falkowbacteria bacterium GW2011_GWA2_41_14]KKS33589.1 MAG: hypothetical protein UU95_C0027G0006 [Parcubacteria group bacterium GW2011_GWC2_42_12]